MVRFATRAVPVILLVAFGLMAAVFDASAAGYKRIRGQVTDVGDGYFMMQSQKVEFMDVTYEGKEFKTSVLDIDGNAIGPERVHKGDVVFVTGQKQKGGSIIAETVHLQKHE